MAYSEPKVTIDLAEYNWLKENLAAPSQGKTDLSCRHLTFNRFLNFAHKTAMGRRFETVIGEFLQIENLSVISTHADRGEEYKVKQ